MTTNTGEMRKYSIFKGYNYMRLSPISVRIWTIVNCSECNCEMLNADLTLYEKDDAALNLSGLSPAERRPLYKAVQPYAGGPSFCPKHYDDWLHGKVLPSETGVMTEEEKIAGKHAYLQGEKR